MRKLLWALVACTLLLPAGAFAADSLLVDNTDPGYAEIVGTDWQDSPYGYLGNSRWCYRDTTPDYTARWTPACSTADKYNVYYTVPLTENASTSALYRIHHAAGDDSIHKDQNRASDYWVFLGAYDMPGDSSGFVEVINDTAGSTGYAFRADAVKWDAVGDTQDIHLVYFIHDFGVVDIGDSAIWYFDFSNVGGDTLIVSDISTSTSEFTIDPLLTPFTFPLAVPPGTTVDVAVKFKPFSAGDYADSVKISSDDPNEAVRICQLAGKSGVLLVDDGDPGYQEIVGTTWAGSGGWDGDSRWATRSLDPMATARWTPNVPSTDTYNAFYYLPATANSATNAKYVVVYSGGRDSLYLNQNRGSGQWIFLAQKTFDGGESGYVEVINDTSVTSGGYAFRADAVKLETPTDTADIYITDWSHNFGQVTVGNSSDWVFTAHNVGAVNLTVDSIVTTDPSFTIPNPATLPQIVAPGAALNITVRFGPLAPGLYSESVTVYSDDPLEGSRSLTLSGEGVGQVVIVDNEDGAPWYTEDSDTTWATSGSAAYGANSRYSTSPKTPAVWAKWTPNITYADYYDVFWIIVSTDWTDGNAKYEIHSSDGQVCSFRVNQQFCTAWKYLGSAYFDTDTSGYVMVINDNLCTGPVVRADAIKFLQTAWPDTIPPNTVTDLAVEKSGDDVFLNWTPVCDNYTGVDYYIVFRNTTPSFIPTSGDSIGEALTPGYTDPGVVGTPGTNYYYVVRAVDKVDNKGDYSNQVGEFDKALSNVK